MDFTSSFSTLTFLSTTFCRQNCALFPACTCLRSHQCCIWLYMIKNIKLHLLSCKLSLFSLTTWCWSHAHSAAGFHHCWHSGSRLSGVRMLDDGKSGRAALGLWAEKESEGRKKNVQQVMRVYEKACCEVAEWMQNTWLDVNVSLLCRGNITKAF